MSLLLITGGSGYIGGCLAQRWVQHGRAVRLLVRDPTGLPENLRRQCQIAIGELSDPPSLDVAAAGTEAVVHAAGLLGRWGMPYQELFEVNVCGTENLIRAAARAGVKRFIHLSAGGVTGPLGKAPADEDYPPQPRTDYERSKWEGERRALHRAAEANLSLLVLRPTFTYGPGDPHKLDLFRAIQQGRFAYIGDGLSTIHPVFVDDLLDGIELALASDARDTAFIVGGPRPVTKRELVEGTAAALGVPAPRRHLPIWAGWALALSLESSARLLRFSPPLTKSRVLMLSRCWGYSIERARQRLNYSPRVDLTEGLRRTVEGYEELEWL